MRAWLNQRLWSLSLLPLAAVLLSCGKPKPPAVAAENVPDTVPVVTVAASRPIPRRLQPLVITNRVAAEALPSPITNRAPVVTCGAPQTLPCGTSEGLLAPLTAHVEHPDGHALSVVWSVDGKEREAHQVAAGTAPTSSDLSISYTFTPGDHAVKVTASDGTLTAFCETTVTIQKDTEEPVIVCPRDVSVRVDPGTCTAVVNFSSTATDNCPNLTATCVPPPGTAFPIGVTVVNCRATDAAGNTALCAFSVVVQFSNFCAKNEGFWRQNPGAWPLHSMTLGNQVYTRTQLLPLMLASIRADASVALARQLIAATLNTAAGSDPRPICGVLAEANDLLGSFGSKLPFNVSFSSVAGQSMLNLSTTLNRYNSGAMTWDCVPY